MNPDSYLKRSERKRISGILSYRCVVLALLLLAILAAPTSARRTSRGAPFNHNQLEGKPRGLRSSSSSSSSRAGADSKIARRRLAKDDNEEKKMKSKDKKDETNEPTIAPTKAPTPLPTLPPTTTSPTGIPTMSPTGIPTMSPTGIPTMSPTGRPTTSPTGSPVVAVSTRSPLTDSRAETLPDILSAIENPDAIDVEATNEDVTYLDDKRPALVFMTFTRPPSEPPATPVPTMMNVTNATDATNTTNFTEAPTMDETDVNVPLIPVTESPTKSPTLRPTMSPTRPPTMPPTEAPTEDKEVTTNMYHDLVLNQALLQQAGIDSQVVLKMSLWPPTGGDEHIAESVLLDSLQTLFCEDPVDGIFLRASKTTDDETDDTTDSSSACVLRSDLVIDPPPPPSMQQGMITTRTSNIQEGLHDHGTSVEQTPVILSLPRVQSVVHNSERGPANILVSNSDPLTYTTWEISFDILQVGPAVMQHAMRNGQNRRIQQSEPVEMYAATVQTLQQWMEWELRANIRDGTVDELLEHHSAEIDWIFYSSLVGEELWTFEVYHNSLAGRSQSSVKAPSTANEQSPLGIDLENWWLEPAIWILIGVAVAMLLIVVILAIRCGRRDNGARDFHKHHPHEEPTNVSAAAAAGGSTKLEPTTLALDHHIAVGGGQNRELDLEHRKTPFEVKINRMCRDGASAANDTNGTGADDSTRVGAASAISSVAVESMDTGVMAWSVEGLDAKYNAWSSEPA